VIPAETPPRAFTGRLPHLFVLAETGNVSKLRSLPLPKNKSPKQNPTKSLLEDQRLLSRGLYSE